MPRPFTEQEREEIRRRLIKAGEELFSRYGLKKTTIEDLTQATGIGKSTFYHFFDSKETLYVDVLLHKYPEFLNQLMRESFEATDDVREALIKFQKALAKLVETHPLARITIGEPEALLKLVPKEKWKELLDGAKEKARPLIEVIRQAQQEGEIIPIDPWKAAILLGAIKALPLQKNLFTPDVYEELVDLMARLIADGLTCTARIRKGA